MIISEEEKTRHGMCSKFFYSSGQILCQIDNWLVYPGPQVTVQNISEYVQYGQYHPYNNHYSTMEGLWLCHG